MTVILLKYLESVNEQFRPDLEPCEMPPYYRCQKGGEKDQKAADQNKSGPGVFATFLNESDSTPKVS